MRRRRWPRARLSGRRAEREIAGAGACPTGAPQRRATTKAQDPVSRVAPGHKDEFCFKRRREERMVKEWANKDKYHPSNGILEPHVQMPRA
jgi:hypothetical protein